MLESMPFLRSEISDFGSGAVLLGGALRLPSFLCHPSTAPFLNTFSFFFVEALCRFFLLERHFTKSKAAEESPI
jgi:hypothetical protein